MASRFVRGGAALLLALALGACDSLGGKPPASMQIALLGFNDFHGNLDAPHLAVPVKTPDGALASVPAGGAAYLASLVRQRRQQHPHTALVAAGDLIGASPMLSSLFLDEPTIEALNVLRLDFAATGNHEYDQGWRELQRMQRGGCDAWTSKPPCRLGHRFAGADFSYLTANTLGPDGQPLFAPTGIKFFRENGLEIGVGFIGLTLRETPAMVRQSGVEGLRFTDEAAAANAQIAPLRAQGADVIVLLIHQGGSKPGGDLQSQDCDGLSGDLLPILARLSDQVDVVISGHTHQAYLCDYGQINPDKPFMVTSAGLYGTLLTEIVLTVDGRSRRVVDRQARQHIVQGEPHGDQAGAVPLVPMFPVYPADPRIQQLLAPYRAVADTLAAEPVGQLAGLATRQLLPNGESVAGRLVADALLAATQAPADGAAQIAFMNSGGIRADMVPDAHGRISYGQLYAVQPFGNTLMSMTLTGAQIQQLLEQQFDSGTNTVDQPRILQVSEGFVYQYDRRAPTGRRISRMQLHGQPLDPDRDYRVGVQSYLGGGGDNFSVFRGGRDIQGGGLDLDALVDYIRSRSQAGPVSLPMAARIQDAGRASEGF
ncbi:bifunctional metallophosphatase/5'-nucleotidase [Castellaniella hirudinis]